jgi:1-aminocyclopropane-1-carboxylate deaminase/D-cysteine desulfhydrase-like pyridoxal-dependent ACC family enzyme
VIVTDPDELTPVEQHGRRWYKRDDLFQPYADVPLSGGKVRQAMRLLGDNRERIVDEYGGWVLTATGVHSPQGLIIARVAHELGLKCVLFVGATTTQSALTKHPMLVRALRAGAVLDTSAGVAYESALKSAADHWRIRHGLKGYFVRFGINLEDNPDAILGSTAAQCANLPEDVERIVIAVGAGITAAGVIIGAAEHRPDARVVCVQIAGYDRRAVIDRIVGDFVEYDYATIKGIPYSRLVQRSTSSGLGLDPIYEAKAHDWMREQPGLDNERVCFWVVGDSSLVRVGTLSAATHGVESRDGAGTR